MDRARIHSLRDRVWIKVPESPELEIELDISQANHAPAIGSEFEDRRCCELLFLDFKGYRDGSEVDAPPVQNTIEARLELLSWIPVRRTINLRAPVLNQERAAGEGGGDSA